MISDQQERTGLGNYFIANYPPFSFWKKEYVGEGLAALDREPNPATPLGLYLHIPFCRKRCKFCYFRVYTDKNSRDVERYLNGLVAEVAMLAKLRSAGGRPLDFVYFGGGTPSYLSAAQLQGLMERLRAIMPWDQAREVAFECEPGTLQKHKLEMLKDQGVSRISLGVENFNPEILQYNGRAHLEEEVYRAYGWAREVGFDQINIDLISGMVGETDDNWKSCVEKTIALAPESVTIYQMELPFNTTFSKELTVIGQESAPEGHVADWPTKRRWVDEAFAMFKAAGYEVSSAYTVVKDKSKAKFIYRDALWTGADMFGTGVASFGHMNGVHLQNVDSWDQYLGMIEAGQIPLGRAFPTSARHRFIREFILQLKTGRIDPNYFRAKFDKDVTAEFEAGLSKLVGEGLLEATPQSVTVTPSGLLQIDRHLPTFFDPEYRTSRYT